MAHLLPSSERGAITWCGTRGRDIGRSRRHTPTRPKRSSKVSRSDSRQPSRNVPANWSRRLPLLANHRSVERTSARRRKD